MKKIFLSIALIILIVCNTYYSNARFETEDYDSSSLDLEVFLVNVESEKKLIDCFDVREDGWFVVGSDEGDTTKYINVYNADGEFMYGYKYFDYGAYHVEWDGNNLLIYSVRGSREIEVDSWANIISVKKIVDNEANNKYWRELDDPKRVVGNKEYVLKNKGIYKYIYSSHSQIELFIDGEPSKIIYQASSNAITKRIVFSTFFCLFFFGGSALVLGKVIKEVK
ncbi:MAG: hypothetical protein IJX78_03000 [Bacilli bacterium]|nr:hypothetical protein [Bacilli bacterium]